MRRVVSWLTEYSYRKAWLVIVAVVLMVGFGGYTFMNVQQELIPDIDFPLLTVVAEAPGSQPDDVVRTVTGPIETALSDLDGLKSTETTSIAGLGVTQLNFEYGTNLDKAKAQIAERLATAGLPAGVRTSVLAFDVTSLPVVTFSLQGALSQAELAAVADSQIVPALRQIHGVASVEVAGGGLTEIVVTVDRKAMLDAGLTYNQIAAALRENNVILPSGQIQSGDTVIPLQTVATYTSIDQIREIGLRSRDGVVILGSIATVEEAPARAVGINRTDGEPSVGIRVIKTGSANTVDVAHAVTSKLDAIEAGLPQGLTVTVTQDQSEFITESINGVVIEGLIGGVLAILVVFLFLSNWRSTLVTAVSIPLSIIVAVILLDQLGHSLNIMTLGGLTIAIGRVIDDSIVVLENIYRHMARGEKTFAAIINGSREVTIAIVGATATTVAVFLPLGLTGGIIGQLFLSFSLAVVFALLASLLVAITVIPVLARFTIAGHVKVEEERDAGHTFMGRLYQPVLRWALGHRWLTVGIAGAMFIGSLALLPLLPIAFLPESGEKIVTVNVNAEPGQTQESVLRQAIEVEGLLAAYDVEQFETVITGAGSDLGAISNIVSGQGANSATLTIRLATGGKSKSDIADELRTQIAKEMPESTNISVSASGGGFGGGIDVIVKAEDPAALAHLPEAAALVEAAVRSVDGVANVTSDVAAEQQTLEVRPNVTAAAEAGITPQEIADSLTALSSNRTITVAQLPDGARGIRLLLSGADASSAGALGALEIAPGIRLDSVAEVVEAQKQVAITRVDGKSAASVTAEITSDDSGAVTADVQSAIDKLNLPAGIETESGGIASSINEGFSSMIIAILVSIVLVYGLMALLFQSLVIPFVILFSLPLAVIGALVALVITGSPLSISALIGILMLVGIVVTNAIVMLEFVIMLQHERGYTVHDALVEGATTRLRPILMTAVAAMLALIPLSLGLTEGALIAADLGRVVIGGLFTSTLLTLLVVPVVYSLADGIKSRFRRAERAGPVQPDTQSAQV